MIEDCIKVVTENGQRKLMANGTSVRRFGD